MTDKQRRKLLIGLKKRGLKLVGPVRFELAFQKEVCEFMRKVEDVFERSRNAPPIHFHTALS